MVAVDGNTLLSLVSRGDPAIVGTPYGYVPTQWVTIMFVVLFSISALVHTGQLIYFRTWWMIPTVILCGGLEILGWSARLWSSISPQMSNPFTIQITATIIGPTPLVAANFIILGRIIRRLGPAYSRLSPRWYARLFLGCDIISLVIQAVGGAMASIAGGNNEDPAPGGHIMLGGIIFQMVTITIYAISAAEFFLRYRKNAPISPDRTVEGKPYVMRANMTSDLKTMSFALVFSTCILFIRSIYRTAELIDGWSGVIITTEVYFNLFDGAMIVLAIYTLNFAHPGRLLVGDSGPQEDEKVSQLNSRSSSV
ncbi:RTA1 like protein-domain-containing protein [Crucibulum laeve]|uniref:RTA1 like protein-domain-containing protein n=1 Tax=Crucibulum laeve TaxID=68775 RepID=A0A5C3LNN1_9AGAR|nr:RTA1 like protein-domain-containing protein [Crucibulum laeve]